jgi:signal transduction histidine kinase
VSRKHNLDEELFPIIDRIEGEYSVLRENFLRAGLSNVGLAVVFHEVERGVSLLHRAVEAGADVAQLRIQSGQLQQVLEQSTRLLRRSEREVQPLKKLVRTARDLNQIRFRLHNVQLVAPCLDREGEGPKASYAFGLALGALTNLIDNAIYWMRVAKPDGEEGKERRRLYLDVIDDWPGGPAVVVADNGTGWSDPPDQLVEPFFSRRPDGMGMGLYYANIVMQLNEGRLEFPSVTDLDLPAGIDGAAVALVFQGV